MAFGTKPRTNLWLYMSSRLCKLGQDAFDHAPARVRDIHQCLQRIIEKEGAGRGDDVGIYARDQHELQADVLATRAEYERSDSILAGMGV